MSSTATATEPAKPAPARPLLHRAGLAFGVVAFANALFYFLSDRYFAERAAKHGPAELVGIDGTRMSFLVFSVAVGVAAIAASSAARLVGHAITLATAALSIVAAFTVLMSDLPGVLGVVLLFLGALLPFAAHASWRGSRAAWATLVSITSVLGLITMFAAPKLARMFELSMWNTMILPGVLAVGATSLLVIHEHYRDR